MARGARFTHVAIALFGIVLAVASSPSRADGDDTPLTNLVALASARLALAEPVARWKWAHQQPIDDPARETALLADVVQRAAANGLDAAYARQFFDDQIAASKIIQNALFANWRATHPPGGPVPDLASETRPQFDRLTRLMTAALVRVAPLRAEPDCPLRVARSFVNWRALTRYDSSQSQAMRVALAHVCDAGGASASG